MTNQSPLLNSFAFGNAAVAAAEAATKARMVEGYRRCFMMSESTAELVELGN
jgi:hypothetical protein